MASYLNGSSPPTPRPAGRRRVLPEADGGVTQVTSPGDQTLHALAQATHQCSSIVRATAEHSPGHVRRDLAAYLTRLRSLRHPHHSGIRLFYQEVNARRPRPDSP